MIVTNVNKIPNISFIKQKRIVDILKLFIAFGIIPCQIDLPIKNHTKYNKLLIFILLNLILLVIMHLSTFWWLRHITITKSSNLVLVVTETFLIWILFIGHLSAVIEAILYQKQYKKLLETLLLIFELSATKLNTIKFTICLKIRILIIISIICHITYTVSTFFNTYYFYYWIHCSWSNLACTFKHILSIFIIDLIKYNLKIISRNVQYYNHHLNCNNISLVHLKQIYGYCWDATQLFNQIYGFSGLVLIGQLFVVTLANFYWLFLHLLSDQHKLITPSDCIYFFTILTNYIILFYLFAKSCDDCYKLCLNIVGNLHKIGASRTQSIVQNFSIQINQTPIKFDAKGFFTINKEFAGSLLMAIITYLVILLQIK